MTLNNTHRRTNLLGTFCAVCIVVLIGVIFSKAQAATIVWDGGGTTNNWSDASNWSINTVPGANDYVFFDGTSNKNAVMDIAVTVGGIQLGSDYTGTVSQGKNLPLSVTLYGFFVKSGIFRGSDADISVVGDVLITGGSFISTSGTLQLTKNWTALEGTFDANGGTVVFNDHLLSNIHTILGSTTFHHVSLRTTNPEMQLLLPSGESSTQIITGDLTLHGLSGATMQLTSDNIGVAARINVQGEVDMRGVRIRDIQNVGKNDIDCRIGCINMGGNSGWIFTIPLLYSLDALAIDGVHMESGNLDTRVDAVWGDQTRTQTDATLYNFSLPSTKQSGWQGTGVTGDPYRLEFDGVDDYVHIGQVGLAGAFSVWFRSDSTDEGVRLLVPSSGSDGYGVWLHNGVLTAGIGQYGLVQSTAVVPGQWYHLVVTRDATSARYYLNGTQFAGTLDTQNGFWSFGDSGFWQGNMDNSLGIKAWWTKTPFMGAVASFRIYGKEANLSPAQVIRMYEEERGRFMTAADGPHISQIMPANEDMSGNTGIIIRGEGFDATTKVSINGQAARSFIIESPTKMMVIPAVLSESGSPGYSLTITVTTTDGTVSAKGSFLSSVATRTNKYVTWFDAANMNGIGATSATAPSSTTWTSLDSGREAKLQNFSVPPTKHSGWQGTGVTGDPYRLEFDGVDDYVHIGQVGLASAFSIWFRSDATDEGVRYLIPSSGSEGYGVMLHNGVLTAGIGQYGLVQSTAVVPGQWYHLVVTRDATSARYYLNGTQFASTLDTQNGFWSFGDSGSWQGNMDNSLGIKAWWTTTPFMGAVASFRIYGKEANLSPAQVIRMYEEERGRFMTVANESRMTRIAPSSYLNTPTASNAVKIWLDARNFSGIGSSNIEQSELETWASLESGREARLLKFSVPPTVSQGTGQTCDPPHVTFDGIDDFIHVGHIGKVRTYAIWFRADKESDLFQWLLSDSGNSGYPWSRKTRNIAYIHKGILGVSIGQYGIVPTTPIKTNQWYHLVVSRDDTAARFYLNGHEFTTLVDNGNGFWTAGDAGWWVGNLDYYIGSDPALDSEHFKGGIASFRLSSDSMTVDQILSMYNEEKDQFGLPDTSGPNPSHGLLPVCTTSSSSSSTSSSSSSSSSSTSSLSSSSSSSTSSLSSSSSSSTSSLSSSVSSSAVSSSATSATSSTSSQSSFSISSSLQSSSSSAASLQSSTSISSSTSSLSSSSSSSSTSSLSSSVSSSSVSSSATSTMSSTSSQSSLSISSSLQSSSSSAVSLQSSTNISSFAPSSASNTDSSSSLSSSSSSSRPHLTPIFECSKIQQKDIKTIGGVIAPIVGGALLHAGLQITFQDVPANMWFAVPIYCDVSAGISSGYDDAEGRSLDVYHPDWPIDYAETARVTLEIAAKDVDRTVGTMWFVSYFSAAQREKFSVYSGGRSIDPHGTPTRGEFIQTLLEAIGMKPDAGRPTYDDVPVDHPYAAAIAKATQLGIISGDDGTNRFRPDEPMNRAESAKIRMTTMELPQLQELYLRRAFIKR